ncbi:MAG: glycosyltransferase family 39 protein, partial [Candidatus Brocadiales bacterium]
MILYIPNLGGRDLWCGRETLYAEVARDMLLNGHWFVPHFNGEIYFNKPPLYFWLIALISMPVGDVTEFTLRLPSALSALGTVLVVYFLGKRLYGARTGFLAGVILASSPGFHKYACVAKLEAPLCLFITASIAAFYVGLTTSSNKRRYFLWGWFLMGLAMLTKGLGVVLIAPVIFLYLLSRRELRRVWETEPVLGGLILLATMMAWLVPGYVSGGPEYIHSLVEHFSHHVGQSPKYMKPFYYITESFVGTLPWSLVLP